MADEQLNKQDTAPGIEPEVRVMELEGLVAERDRRIAELEANMAELQQGLAESKESLGRAVGGYRTLVLQANPEVPAELVAGESITAVDEAVKSAQQIVGRVKQKLAAETAAVRVPAGAPQRTAPDVSGLTAREKIHYGLGK